MIDTKVCEWLIGNGGVTTRYRIYRELLQDEIEAKKIENELLENDGVQKWLKLLKPDTPPQHWSMHHGSFDFCFENAMPKVTQMGLHAGFEQVRDAVGFYLRSIKDCMKHTAEKGILYRNDFQTIIATNFLINAGFKHNFILDFLLISKYPVARRTKWFAELFEYLEKYKTERNTYLFPAEWLKESSAYAVGGNHLSFGENRRKKIWSEIESTLYMQLLKHRCSII